MKVLSLFDGMACGMLAMMAAGVEVESYDAYEIDKYAVKTATHNFPMIEQHGDVFAEDFTKYDGVDFLVGGSPCTYWSIAQTKNRETVASGLGWDLFSQYVRALHEAKPKYFIYENNKSMSKEIRASIDEAFGFDAVCINSALVSAQNRQRLYWIGIRREDGTYHKANIGQPEDRGILLKDVLDGVASKPLSDREMDYMIREPQRFEYGYIQKSTEDKAKCITANISKGVPYNVLCEKIGEPICIAERGRMYRGEPQHYEARPDGKTNTLTSVEKDNCVAEPVGTTLDGKSFALTAYYSTGQNAPHTLERHLGSMVSEPVCCTEPRGAARRGEHERNQCWEIRGDEKSNAVITGHQSRLVAEPVNASEDGKAFCVTSRYYKGFGENPGRCIEKHRDSMAAEPVNVNSNGKAVTQCGQGGGLGAKTGLYAVRVGTMPNNAGDVKENQSHRIYSVDAKGRTLMANSRGGGNTDISAPATGLYALPVDEPKCYAVPCEWDENGYPVKAVSCSDGKVYPVYKVENGQITIKDKQYPIKLRDGYYIIRKLTVSECMRLQTVPEWYDFSCVSNSQAYKMLGNGWTVEVIAHLIRSALCDTVDPQMTLF